MFADASGAFITGFVRFIDLQAGVLTDDAQVQLTRRRFSDLAATPIGPRADVYLPDLEARLRDHECSPQNCRSARIAVPAGPPGCGLDARVPENPPHRRRRQRPTQAGQLARMRRHPSPARIVPRHLRPQVTYRLHSARLSPSLAGEGPPPLPAGLCHRAASDPGSGGIAGHPTDDRADRSWCRVAKAKNHQVVPCARPVMT